MKRYLFDLSKLIVMFICFTLLFYFGLRAIHEEYERYHRYDQPEGPAVKVFSEEDRFIDYIYLLFRLGE